MWHWKLERGEQNEKAVTTIITVKLTANHSEKGRFHATVATLDLEFVSKLYRTFRPSQRIPYD